MISNDHKRYILGIIDKEFKIKTNGIFDKEDLFQEAMTKILSILRENPNTNLNNSFLYTVTKNHLINFLGQNQSPFSISAVSFYKHRAVLPSRLRSYLRKTEQYQLIDYIKFDVDPESQLVYNLLLEDNSIKEIAEKTGLSRYNINKKCTEIYNKYVEEKNTVCE